MYLFIYTHTDIYVNLCTCKHFILRVVFNGFIIFLKEKCGIEYTNMKVIEYIAISDLFCFQMYYCFSEIINVI